jgi:hypothetical protein
MRSAYDYLVNIKKYFSENNRLRRVAWGSWFCSDLAARHDLGGIYDEGSRLEIGEKVFSVYPVIPL